MSETTQTFDLRNDLTAGEVASWMSSLPTHALIKVESGVVGHYTNERVEPVRIRRRQQHEEAG